MTTRKQTGGKIEESFLSRWDRVKRDHAQETPAVAAVGIEQSTEAAEQIANADAPLQHKSAEDRRPEPTLPNSRVSVELPSLDSLTPQSDYSPFMAKDVDMKLRNQAMKKLFTDPHYNVMDRLDIYIDDYSVHAPLPLEVIRQMNIAKTLGLFDDEEDQESGKVANVETVAPIAPSVEATTTTCRSAGNDAESRTEDSVESGKAEVRARDSQ